MKKFIVGSMLIVAATTFADDTNIPWQFTGDTNRVASAESAATAVTGLVRAVPQSRQVAYFDSLVPGFCRLSGQNLDTTPAGVFIIVR